MSPRREKMLNALHAYINNHSHAAMRALIEKVAGTYPMSEITEDREEAVIAACEKTPRELGIASGDGDAAESFAERTKRAGGHWRVFGRAT